MELKDLTESQDNLIVPAKNGSDLKVSMASSQHELPQSSMLIPPPAA